LDKRETFPIYKMKENSIFTSKVERVNYLKESKKTEKKKHGRSNSVMNTLKNAMRPAIEELESDSESDNGVPGPGSYNVHDMTSNFKAEPVSERHQFFGSTRDRFPKS